MDKEDARYQTLVQLHERRKQVVRLHKRGTKIMRIVEMTGLSYPAVRRTIDLYEQGGWPAICPAARGREAGQARILSPEQEQAIQKIICDKRPEQLKMDFFLWSRAAVMQLIDQECQIKLGVRTVANTSNAGASPRKSRSRRPMNSAPRPCRPGLMSTTLPLRPSPRRRAARFTGETKQPW